MKVTIKLEDSDKEMLEGLLNAKYSDHYEITKLSGTCLIYANITANMPAESMINHTYHTNHTPTPKEPPAPQTDAVEMAVKNGFGEKEETAKPAHRTGRPNLDRAGIKEDILDYLSGADSTMKDIVAAVHGASRNKIEPLIHELENEGKIYNSGRNRLGGIVWKLTRKEAPVIPLVEPEVKPGAPTDTPVVRSKDGKFRADIKEAMDDGCTSIKAVMEYIYGKALPDGSKLAQRITSLFYEVSKESAVADGPAKIASPLKAAPVEKPEPDECPITDDDKDDADDDSEKDSDDDDEENA